MRSMILAFDVWNLVIIVRNSTKIHSLESYVSKVFAPIPTTDISDITKNPMSLNIIRKKKSTLFGHESVKIIVKTLIQSGLPNSKKREALLPLRRCAVELTNS
ncbi:hypothetical protein L596_009857 [Steinernema carpocapsae]|uniref:Uncharacterized protein n=1 Tax=Steinernema carpocapsae TaxID=34508 RepID=A0A4U5PGJ2_STECR|nr:hypothetical protein L596_009857 [Steinernema carpocapsae]